MQRKCNQEQTFSDESKSPAATNDPSEGIVEQFKLEKDKQEDKKLRIIFLLKQKDNVEPKKN